MEDSGTGLLPAVEGHSLEQNRIERNKPTRKLASRTNAPLQWGGGGEGEGVEGGARGGGGGKRWTNYSSLWWTPVTYLQVCETVPAGDQKGECVCVCVLASHSECVCFWGRGGLCVCVCVCV